MGLPDGAGVFLTWRPVNPLRVQLGGTHNLAGFGLRGGVGWVPWTDPVAPSVNLDVGYAFGLAVDRLGGVFGVELPDGAPRRIRYGYVNVHLGLDIEADDLVVLIRGGGSFLHGVAEPVGPVPKAGLRFIRPTRGWLVAPSAKIGVAWYAL